MLPVHSQGRAGHRRSSYSSGPFSSLGALPRRNTKSPTFHFNQPEDDDDDDDDNNTDSDHDLPIHDDQLRILPPLRLKLNHTSFNAVPFPRSSPPITRTASTPSVRKPLKSSLKSSSSSPHIPFPPQSLVPSIMFPDLHPQHQRSSSAPSTPMFASSSKNVHFPSQEEGGLATIRLFNRSARPASLSRLGEETDTETDGDSSTTSGKYVNGSTFPFPRQSPLNPSKQKCQYEIDWPHSSGIPRTNVEQTFQNVFFDSLQIVHSGDHETKLQGTLLVRNITYQKTVMVRYTLDDWETVNDVLGWYHMAETEKNGWDRFKFSISLAGSQQGLEKRVMWLVAKYAGGADPRDREGGDTVEWWDNNGGKNYRVGFRKVVEQEEKVYKRGVVVSAPTTPISFSGQQSLSPYQQERQRAQHQAAITETTFARLKKLNLKNYAAPASYRSPTPPLLTLTYPSPTSLSSADPSPLESPNPNTTVEMSSPTLSTTSTSADSSPLQTPTQEDEEDEWKIAGGGGGDHEEQQLSWSLSMESGHFATVASPIASTPLASPIPVSIPGGLLYGNDTNYPYPSKTPTNAGGVEMGTSPPFSDLGRDGSVYWDWASAAGAVSGESKEARKEPSAATGAGALMPPQRRRGTIKRTSGMTSSSGSGSDSNSKNPNLSIALSPPSSPSPTPTPTPSSTTTCSPLKRKPTPPRLNLPTSTFTPPPAASSPSSVQSPRHSAVPQRRYGHRQHYQSMPTSGDFGLSMAGAGGDASSSDAIYQALVREWCFAQGPSSSSSSTTSGEMTPVQKSLRESPILSPSPLGRELTCVLGDE